MNKGRIITVLKLIGKQTALFDTPSVTLFSKKKDPFLVLVSCILSLRTKDKVTVTASNRLFCVADNPYGILRLSRKRIEKLIYPVGFYRNKAKTILDICNKIIRDFDAKVPDNLNDLLSLKGVGRKTANLVLGLGFNIPAICVDTHVHRISNRLGWINTDTPEQSEMALKDIVPRVYWIRLNTLLVTFGQNICLPVSPYCSKCFIEKHCAKNGVKSSR